MITSNLCPDLLLLSSALAILGLLGSLAAGLPWPPASRGCAGLAGCGAGCATALGLALGLAGCVGCKLGLGLKLGLPGCTPGLGLGLGLGLADCWDCALGLGLVVGLDVCKEGVDDDGLLDVDGWAAEHGSCVGGKGL